MSRRVAIRVEVLYPRDVFHSFPFRPPEFALSRGDLPPFFTDNLKCFNDSLFHDWSPALNLPDKQILLFIEEMEILDSMRCLHVVRKKDFPSSVVIIGDRGENEDPVWKKQKM
jgi:hypothetical protein